MRQNTIKQVFPLLNHFAREAFDPGPTAPRSSSTACYDIDEHTNSCISRPGVLELTTDTVVGFRQVVDRRCTDFTSRLLGSIPGIRALENVELLVHNLCRTSPPPPPPAFVYTLQFQM